ncbi:hypothetical protein K503DRAFT_870475 [Rhizopogon vinicolor AM-OR11-026]|uniref:DUF6533 domain-containing protein n=1 Tax=Rhizopogon vinicolor AM-OR11-026 TaxID=1314800 RepID=A0A1B7MGT3_9AGAM|nr:hypothetical protein K503DRAFT_870475 [Rhizopogon vinicolor AM-OR11-026]
MSDQLDEDVINLYWNNYTSVVIFVLISYEYLVLLEDEVKYVWKRRWSRMTCLYLVVRYLGLFLALLCGCWGGLWYMPDAVSYDLAVLIEWGFSVYYCFVEAILIWRLYALYNQSKRLLHVLSGLFLPIVTLSIGTDIYLYSRPSSFSVIEVVTPIATYCTLSFHLGPMPAIYTSIPMICYDILLVVLATAILVKHLKERRNVEIRPNTYMVMIVRHHVIYFVLNLTNQILLVILWIPNIPAPVANLAELFNSTAPFILAPRLIISIWNTHAHDECENVSTTFDDCVCWTSPPTSEEYEVEYEMDSRITLPV